MSGPTIRDKAQKLMKALAEGQPMNTPVRALTLLRDVPVFKACSRSVRQNGKEVPMEPYFWLETVPGKVVGLTSVQRARLYKRAARALRAYNMHAYMSRRKGDENLYVFYNPAFLPDRRKWRTP